MKIVEDITQLKKYLKTEKQTIGFVPTMGALHEGHISLIKKAKEENEKVVVSIFINPTQFLQGEDFDKYPKKLEADIKILQLCQVDYLFLPIKDEIYTDDEVLIKAPKIRGFILEGYKRAGHFDGMLQIVLKLFNIVNPTKAYFGKKDAQQLILVEQMVKNFFLDIQIVACDIVRDKNGLALSSRNTYLNELEYQMALNISKSLKIALNLVSKDILDTSVIRQAMLKQLINLDVEYVQIVNRNFDTLTKVILNNTIILVAVKIGTTRLIDNIWI